MHPAIDAINGNFYFGLVIPGSNEGKIQNVLCFVDSKKGYFIYSPAELGKRNLLLRHPDVVSELRWDLKKIHSYLSNDIKYEGNILDEIESKFRKYLEFKEDDREYVFIVLWIIGTYLQPVWETYPYLSVSGRKGTGKTKLLKFIEKLSFNPIFSSNISTASLFRLIQSLRCTLLIDEAEKYSHSERQEEIRNIVNAGYKKGAYVIRSTKTEKGRIFPEKFETFSPKAFVSYKGLEGVVEDRCINIIMRLSVRSEITKTEILDSDPEWQIMRDKLYVFALENWEKVSEIYNSLPEIPGIEARYRELWRPILALAKFFSDEVYDKICVFALERAKESSEEDAVEMIEASVIRALLEIVTEDNFYNLSTIYEKVKEIEGELPWLSAKWVGKTLSRTFGFKKRRRSSEKGRPRQRFINLKKVREIAQEFNIVVLPPDGTKGTYGTKGTAKEFSQVELMTRLGELRQKDDTLKIFLERAQKALPNEPIERLREATKQMTFRLSEDFLRGEDN